MKTRLRLALEWWLLLLCLAVLHFSAALAPLTEKVDALVFDSMTSQFAPHAAQDILIIGIDAASLQREGAWPWPRSKLALLVDHLHRAGARAIVLDVLLQESGNAADDDQLQDSIARSGRVFLPASLQPMPNREAANILALPLAPFRDGAAGYGHVILPIPSDGVQRGLLTRIVDSQGLSLDHLVLEVTRRAAIPSIGRTPLPDKVLVPYAEAGSYQHVSSASLMRGEVDQAFVTGRVAIIGATAPGLGDSVAVPSGAGGQMSGPEYLANAIDALRQDRLIQELSTKAVSVWTFLAIVCLMVGLWWFGANGSALWTLSAVLLTLVSAYALLYLQKEWIAPGQMVIMAAVAYPVWSWRRLTTLSRLIDGIARQLRAGLDDGALKPRWRDPDQFVNRVEAAEWLVLAMHERHALLRQVLEMSNDALCLVDAGGNLQIVNHKGKELFGPLELGSPLAAIEQELSRVPGDSPDLFSLPDGRIVERAISHDSGLASLQGLALYCFRDVTKSHNARLEQERMLEFLSHDIRSPQVAILSLARGGLRKSGGGAAVFDRISVHAQRGLRLADNFLHLARIGVVPLARTTVRLGALVDQAIDSVAESANEAAMNVCKAIGNERLVLHCDAELVVRAIENLLLNAIVHARRPGGTVSVSQKAVTRGGIRFARIEVADEGPGLDATRTNDPFARFGPNSRMGGGGLGLAYIREVAVKHGGRPAYSLRSGGGSLFVLELPMRPMSKV